MRTIPALVAAVAAISPLSRTVDAQTRTFTLESAHGLRLHNVAAEPAAHHGKKGLRLTVSSDGRRQLEAASNESWSPELVPLLAVVEGVTFANGVIEAEIAGAPAPDAPEGARGFVGLAFRVQDGRSYDAFYLRPTNGRADDQERRNRSVQYISHPDWPWFRLRRETPARYESYVDLLPDAWTKIRIEVRGDKARLFVHDQQQPTLVVNDVKSGATTAGGIALWIGAGTVAHFRNLIVRSEP